MFIGEYEHNLDAKGRLAIPVKFRNSLSSGAVVTRGLDRCLFVFTREEWEILAGKISALPMTASNARAFSRLMLSGASECEIDSQGRILIPDYLRKFGGLEKNVVLAGVYSRIEIWDAESWNEYKTKTEKESDTIAEQMTGLGI